MERSELAELLLDHQWLGPVSKKPTTVQRSRCLCGAKFQHGSADKMQQWAEHVTDVIFKKELNI